MIGVVAWFGRLRVTHRIQGLLQQILVHQERRTVKVDDGAAIGKHVGVKHAQASRRVMIGAARERM